MNFPQNLSTCHHSRLFFLLNRCCFGLLGSWLRAILIAASLSTSDNSGGDWGLGVALELLMGSFTTFLAHFSLLPFLQNILRDAFQVLIPIFPFFGTLGLTGSLLLAACLALAFAFPLGPSPIGLPLVLALAVFFFGLLVVTTHHLVTLGI